MYTVGGSVNWCSYRGNQYGDSSKEKKKKIQLPYDFNNSTSAYSFIGRKQNTDLERYMHPHVHRSIVYDSQDKDTT